MIIMRKLQKVKAGYFGDYDQGRERSLSCSLLSVTWRDGRLSRQATVARLLKADERLFDSEKTDEDPLIQHVFGSSGTDVRPLTLGQLCRAVLKEPGRQRSAGPVLFSTVELDLEL